MSDTPLNVLRLGVPGRPSILLLHGWAHSLEVIRPLGELLSEDADVHIVDLPGHGTSAEPDSVWSMEDFAKRMFAYLESVGVREFVGIGHSFGGKTLIKMASMRPDAMERLVLINSSGLTPRRPFKKEVRMRTLALLRWVVKKLDRWCNLTLFEKWFIPKFASPDYLQAGTLRKTFVRTVNEDLTNEATQVRCPTLLLWSELDTETPLDSGSRLAALIPNAKLVVLKGKGHTPFVDAGAHLCMFHIKSFLSEMNSSEAAHG